MHVGEEGKSVSFAWLDCLGRKSKGNFLKSLLKLMSELKSQDTRSIYKQNKIKPKKVIFLSSNNEQPEIKNT